MNRTEMTGEQATKPTLDDIAAGLLETPPADKPKSAPKAPTPAKAAEAPEDHNTDDDAPTTDRQRAKPRDADDDADDDQDIRDTDEGAEDDEDDFFTKLFDSEAEDADAPATDDADEDGDTDAEQTFEVKVDGKVKQVPLRNLLKAYSGEGAIEARLQQATEARRKAEEEAKPYVQHAQALAHRIQSVYDHYNTALFAPRVEPPDEALMETDPVGYMQQDAAYRKDQARLQSEQAQMQQVLQQASALHQEQVKASLREEYGRLTQALPKLKDPKIAKAFKGAINEAAKVYGFKPEEVSAVMDHRLLLMAADAAAYRAIKARTGKAKTTATQKVTPSAPMPVKPGSQQTRNNTGSRKAKERARALEKARRSGHVDDVAATLLL